MWLIVTFIAAVAAVTAYLLLKKHRKKFKLGLLSLMLFGTFLMVLVDHLIALISGEPFIELTTDGLIQNATLLGIVMVIPIFIIWIIAVALSYSSKQAS